ncbi:hypothetical protein [uncultured Leuconostoc sp.]|uniref:hypothetical protein n=1 Tax=uncultured Leuconostoc sp. TaxID=173262 RepID=UPI0025D1A531|nr:hypothetical protein [uncultured Leuconostoc sp.]
MKTQLINGFWSATSFTDKLNEELNYLESNGHEIIEVQYKTPVLCYSAMVIYK